MPFRGAEEDGGGLESDIWTYFTCARECMRECRKEYEFATHSVTHSTQLGVRVDEEECSSNMGRRTWSRMDCALAWRSSFPSRLPHGIQALSWGQRPTPPIPGLGRAASPTLCKSVTPSKHTTRLPSERRIHRHVVSAWTLRRAACPLCLFCSWGESRKNQRSFHG